jgi:hypothetical protein
MNSLEDIKNILNGHKKELQTKFRVKNIGVFGSYVRGENKSESDLDILVEFDEPVGLFAFMDLEDYIENLVHTKIDLVSAKALKPRIGQRVLKEVVYI